MIRQFDNYNDLKNYINSINKELKVDEKNNIIDKNIEKIIYDDKDYNKNFEENIDFNGDLSLNNLKSENIYGNIEVNKLFITDCYNLKEINIYSSSLQNLIITLSNISSNNIIIDGYYPNLNNIDIYMEDDINLNLYLNGIFEKKNYI